MLWPSTVRLSDQYFHSLKKHAVPLDSRSVGALAGRALALDVYTWLAQRLHRVPAGKPALIGWASLAELFGPGYDRVRDFCRRLLATLAQAHADYPQARLAADCRGLTLTQSPPQVAAPAQLLIG